MEINETAEDAFDAAEDQAFAEPETPEAEYEAPEEDAGDVWESPTFSSPEEFEAYNQGIAAQALEERYFSEQQQPGPAAPEVYTPPPGPAEPQYPPEVQALMQEDPELGRALVSMSSSMAEQIVEAKLGEVKPLLDLLASDTGTRYAKEQLEGFQQQLGDFNQDAAMAIAAGLVDSDGANAFGKAALMTRQIEHTAEQRGYERGKREALDSLRASSTAPVAPGTSVAASEGQTSGFNLGANPSDRELEDMWDAVESNALASTRPGFPG